MIRNAVTLIVLLFSNNLLAQGLKVELMSADVARYYKDWPMCKFRLNNTSGDTIYIGTGYFKESLFCSYSSDSIQATLEKQNILLMPPNSVKIELPEFTAGCVFREYDPKKAGIYERFQRRYLSKNKRVATSRLPYRFDRIAEGDTYLNDSTLQAHDNYEYLIEAVIKQNDSIHYVIPPHQSVVLYRTLSIDTWYTTVKYSTDIKLIFRMTYRSGSTGDGTKQELVSMKVPRKVAELFLAELTTTLPSAP